MHPQLVERLSDIFWRQSLQVFRRWSGLSPVDLFGLSEQFSGMGSRGFATLYCLFDIDFSSPLFITGYSYYVYR